MPSGQKKTCQSHLSKYQTTKLLNGQNTVRMHGDRESCLALSIHVETVLEQMPGSVILQPILHISSE